MQNNTVIPNPYEGLTKEEALETMLQLVKDGARNHIRMGLLYNYLVDSKLLEGSKQYKSPLDFICDNVEEVSRTSLLDYGAVARAFREEVGVRYGVTRLRVLLSYKDATKLELDYAEPGTTVIQVPNKKGEVKPKLFADCSLEELRQALKRVREEEPSTPFPPEDRALVDGYREAVLRSVPQGSPVRVQLNRHKGESVMEIRTLPLGQVHNLIEALLSQYSPMASTVPTPLKRADKTPRS
ncbi:hypothetical protein [Hyalangium gracile]|uniref:hypothetical protein n=1 Tax=Hyalangium gracile TaxID=394092 RepID=UPI001CC9B6CA|nr:hypothetical protein [Hyalangium gracile]